MIDKGSTETYLDEAAIREIVSEAVSAMPIQSARVLIIVPDGTRTAPIPQMFRIFQDSPRPHVRAVDYLVALGTHPPMSDAQLSRLIGTKVANGRVGETQVFNHLWNDPASFTKLGTTFAAEISRITNGLMKQDVCITLNKLILEYDHIIVCVPVFPPVATNISSRELLGPRSSTSRIGSALSLPITR